MTTDRPAATPRARTLTIIAQDPAVTDAEGRILRARIEVPAEVLAAGPWGHRVQVIDYDASTHTLYAPRDDGYGEIEDGSYVDPYRDASDEQLLGDPQFHAQNVYAIAMRTLATFEKALGRRVGWGFSGHQLKIAPHAFADANAFYTAQDEALVFGYFPTHDIENPTDDRAAGMVFSCLSHDVVAHESTHALIDGLRHRFIDPSSPDQAGFHEGLADTVALLSVFSLTDVVDALLDFDGTRSRSVRAGSDSTVRTVAAEKLTADALRQSALLGLAEQMGEAMKGVRGNPLRRAGELTPSKDYLKDPEFREPHRRGEILLAAMMNTFLEVWTDRLRGVREVTPGALDRQRVVEEGANAADYLLTMAIRALDYTPPVDLRMSDFLSAMLTADLEIRPDDSKYQFRQHLRDSFAGYGIEPASKGTADAPGCWVPGVTGDLAYTRTHFESMLHDPDEVFWFIWENLDALGVYEGAYGHVLSVRPCLRVAPDGFALRETIVEFMQVLDLAAHELENVREHRQGRDRGRGVQKPEGMPDNQQVRLYGGNTLIFDEYGRLKYNVHNGITDAERQTERLAYLWEAGFFTPEARELRKFSNMHMRRAIDLGVLRDRGEEW